VVFERFGGINITRFCLLGRTYRAALEQILKKSNIFSKKNIEPTCVCLIFCCQSVFWCLIRYCLVGIHERQQKIRCEIISENKHVFYFWIHHVRICTALAQLMWADPSNIGDLESRAKQDQFRPKTWAQPAPNYMSNWLLGIPPLVVSFQVTARSRRGHVETTYTLSGQCRTRALPRVPYF
jgi:hypothetical protein